MRFAKVKSGGKVFFFQAEDGIRDQPRSRGLGDVYKRQSKGRPPLDGALEANKRSIVM